MSHITEKRNQIELKINKWKEQGCITDISRKNISIADGKPFVASTDGDAFILRIKSSGGSFNVIYTGIACKVSIDGCEETREFKWVEDGVVENVPSYIKELLKIA